MVIPYELRRSLQFNQTNPSAQQKSNLIKIQQQIVHMN